MENKQENKEEGMLEVLEDPIKRMDITDLGKSSKGIQKWPQLR